MCKFRLIRFHWIDSQKQKKEKKNVSLDLTMQQGQTTSPAHIDDPT